MRIYRWGANMKCLILAAGYATRLYPLTENFPKPLLKVNGKSIIEWLIDDLRSGNKIEEFIIITNHKFADIFVEWAKEKTYKVKIVDDGTISNETRLGAVNDIEFAINKLKISSDILVLAGDNVLDFSLNKFLEYSLTKKASCVMRYYEKDVETLHKRGVLELDGDLVLSMQEKPKEPKSQWCCPPFYYYTAEDTKKIKTAIKEGCAVDAPGSFISWLAKKTSVYAMEMSGNRYDIGNLESYKKACTEYKGVKD